MKRSLLISKSSIPSNISAPDIAVIKDNDLYLVIFSWPNSQANTSVITGIIQLIKDAWAGVVSSRPLVNKAVFSTIPSSDNNIKKYQSLPLGKLSILLR